jgi:hypothetical protein
LLPVNQTRGIHCCPFCKGEVLPTGSYEMRVAGACEVYAAPSLVHHYVVAHGYRPPDEFIAAVMAWNDHTAEPFLPPAGWRFGDYHFGDCLVGRDGRGQLTAAWDESVANWRCRAWFQWPGCWVTPAAGGV